MLNGMWGIGSSIDCRNDYTVFGLLIGMAQHSIGLYSIMSVVSYSIVQHHTNILLLIRIAKRSTVQDLQCEAP